MTTLDTTSDASPGGPHATSVGDQENLASGAPPSTTNTDDDRVQGRRALTLTLVLVALASLVGFGIRWYTVTVSYPTCPEPTYFGEKAPDGCFQDIGWGDAYYYRTQAQLLADGQGFANPTAWLQGQLRTDVPQLQPGAGHPPVYTMFLATLIKAGVSDVDDHRKAQVLVGTLGVALIGLAGWQIGGRRRHVVAPLSALLAATYPMLWINDFRYLSESIYIPIVAVLIMACYRFWAKPGWGSAAFLGGMIGLSSLTRGEGIFLLAFTVPPLLWGMRSLTVKHRLALGAVVSGVAFAVLGPWVAHNLSRFPTPVTVTSGTGMVLIHGSCDQAFYGDAIGYYSFACANVLTPLDKNPAMAAEEVADAEARSKAITYITANADQLPVVMLARAGRMWDIYDVEGNIRFNAVLEGRGETPSRIGLWFYAALIPFGILGLLDLRRRGIPLSPIVGLAAAVTLTAMLSFGITRYRIPADVALVIAAAIGFDLVVRRAVVWLRTS